MAVAVLRPLDAPPAEPVPVTALLLAPPPICAALRGRGGGLVLAVRPAGRVGAQAVLLSAVALEAGGRRGAELWLRGALLRRLGLAAGLAWTGTYGQLTHAPAQALAGTEGTISATAADWPRETAYGSSVLVYLRP